MKRSSTRSLGNSHKRKADLWTDSDMSSEDDFVVPPMSSTFKPAAQEHYESIQTHCCLICSILPSLSQINCCSQHLSALTGTPLRPFVYIMHRDNDRSKRRAELWSPSSSSRSSSTTLGRQKTKRLINKPRPRKSTRRVSLISSLTGKVSSANMPSARRRSHHLQSVRSSSTSSVSSIDMNRNKNSSSRRASACVLTSTRRKSDQTPSLKRNRSINTTPEQLHHPTTPIVRPVEPQDDSTPSPRIQLQRVVHVKDEAEEVDTFNLDQFVLNMAQATRQMSQQAAGKPRILLKRVSFER